MTAGPWLLTNNTRTYLAENGYGNMVTASAFAMGLATSSSNLSASSTTYSALTNEVASGNGYTTGGITFTFSATGTTIVTLNPTASIIWTASGSGITAHFMFVYEISTGDILTYALADGTGVDVTVLAGNTWTVSAINAIITIE
jgi:hypothetical protein